MIKRGLIFIFLILLASTVYASIDLSINPNEVLVLKGEDGLADLTIINSGDADTFYVQSLDLNWLLDSSDLLNIMIGQGESQTVKLKFKQAADDLVPRSFAVPITIVSRGSGETEQKLLTITLVDPNNFLKTELITPEIIDPRKETNKVELKITNIHNSVLEDVQISLSSDIFSDTKTTTINPLSANTETFYLKLNPDAQEGDHNVEISYYWKDKLVGKTTEILKVSQYKGIRDIISEDNSILVQKQIIKKMNEGNAIITEKYVKEVSFIQKLFTSTEPKPDEIIKTDSGYKLTWILKFEPKQEYEIKITTNYRNPLIIAIFVLLVGVLLYFKIKRDVVVKKQVLTMRGERGLSNIKVMLTIYNKRQRNLHNVRILERIPNLVGKPFNFFGPHPEKVSRVDTMTTLFWKIPELKSKQEVIITYRAESRQRRLGKLMLPPTLVKYMQGEKLVVSKSNRILLFKHLKD
ncbi:MAG: hypothetical protein PHD81_04550 [Candidatus Nanoarchaeia archaeon]|nr:hypothetical protein [Candidatus Nanoarchaeia archaeon]MDD5588346.1 hypothetical protein [Candidatus Nanoarchaeia archaeon]